MKSLYILLASIIVFSLHSCNGPDDSDRNDYPTIKNVKIGKRTGTLPDGKTAPLFLFGDTLKFSADVADSHSLSGFILEVEYTETEKEGTRGWQYETDGDLLGRKEATVLVNDSIVPSSFTVNGTVYQTAQGVYNLTFIVSDTVSLETKLTQKILIMEPPQP
ncbi:hypothetical protein FUAX_26330 [Fulvitalea axinellae]|uniref:DUF4625 domain-containing protein n=1 Tax=Fulvitalea axinellae TaxID=1182444 RepID=A0AAU9CMC6_9BACT|nr:hypothetical protein FUAX_26330 [Fulvitalea axinellae]